VAQYYLLEDFGDDLYAGTVQTTADVGGRLPAFWVPSPNVDPIDQAAIAAYFAAGPRPRGLIRQHWTAFPVRKPVFNWAQQANGVWSLSGITTQPAGLVAFLISDTTGQVLTTDSGTPLVAP